MKKSEIIIFNLISIVISFILLYVLCTILAKIELLLSKIHPLIIAMIMGIAFIKVLRKGIK